jgi:putative MATE family efflux protein
MASLVDRGVARTLFSMAFPMLAGTLALNVYSLTDTWFVSRLGTVPLAAMGFTFPVIMLLSFAAGGLGTGVTTLVSHALGRRDRAAAATLVTHGIALTVAVSVTLSLLGYFTVTAVFTRLGADAATLILIRQYMGIWYFGGLTMALPMLGNGILISAGDSRAASGFMILGTAVNAVLNPILIFGCFGRPGMGIAGSALATVLAQGVSTVWLIHLLARKHRLLVFHRWRLGAYLASSRRIIGFAIPSILSMILMPISAAVVTRLVSGFGREAIAACGAAERIEMFAFVIPMALGISLTPFVSQNFGADRVDRIREAFAVSVRFALGYGGLVAIVFCLGAPWLARVFSHDPKVVVVLVAYIRIICFGYGMMEVHRYCGFFLTGLHHPASATVLNAIRVLVLLLPLSCLGAHYLGFRGVFWGRLTTDLVVGCVGLAWVSRVSRGMVQPVRPRPAVAAVCGSCGRP